MAVAPTSNGQPTGHVPAWKKLGLKLKNAKEVPIEPYGATATTSALPAQVDRNEDSNELVRDVNAQNDQSTGKSKRTRDADDDTSERKKAKRDGKKASVQEADNSIAASAPKGSRNAAPDGSIFKNQASPTDTSDKAARADVATPSSLKRHKSVSFSQDTKTEDGSSAQNLFQAWVDEQNAAESVGASETLVSGTKKKPKKSKAEKSSTTETKDGEQQVKARTPKSGKEAPAYLQYLQQYHADRESWKFNKSKQNDLLKNIWNVYRISPEHNEALAIYISGLQGAAARQRLREAAKTILEEAVSQLESKLSETAEKLSIESEQLKMEDPAARVAALDTALHRRLEKLHQLGQLSDSDYEEEKETGRTAKERAIRADLLGATLRSDPQDDVKAQTGSIPTPQNASSGAPDVAKPLTRRRSRKARTAGSGSDDSSSSSSSNSDSDSDDGGTSVTKKRKTGASSNTSATSSDDNSASSEDESDDSSSSGDSDNDSSSESESESDGDSDSDASPPLKAKKQQQQPSRPPKREDTPPKKAVPFDKELLDKVYASRKIYGYRR